jgi:hypothetical protein
MKAHIFRELVNDLRDIATQRHGSEQLRERISERLRQDVSIDEDPANDGWIPWAGGECPVLNMSRVDVVHRNGDIFSDGFAGYAQAKTWTHDNHPRDIIAYRIVRK